LTLCTEAHLAVFGFKGVALGARERIAGSVYGTTVVLAVLAGEASVYENDLWKLDALVLATVLILWIAHAYAHGLGESLRLERQLTRAELSAIMSHELAIPLASVLPLAAISIGALRAFDDTRAFWAAFALGVATLAIQGVRFARLERLSLVGTIASVAINLTLVLMIVALKVLVSH
jgi:signal transduction histidine kinase